MSFFQAFFCCCRFLATCTHRWRAARARLRWTISSRLLTKAPAMVESLKCWQNCLPPVIQQVSLQLRSLVNVLPFRCGPEPVVHSRSSQARYLAGSLKAYKKSIELFQKERAAKLKAKEKAQLRGKTRGQRTVDGLQADAANAGKSHIYSMCLFSFSSDKFVQST